MTRAALYLRISQDRTGEALGVTRQQEDCAELATQLGWDVTEVYIDNDISAISGKPRPAYQRMLLDLDAGEIDAIVAWHPDRLYRKVKDLGDLVDVCKRNNTQIATVKAGTIDLTTPTGRLVAGLLAQVATYEGEAKADRWRRSVRQRRERGDFAPSGPRMYGWTREGEVIEDEAEVIRWMADELLAGTGTHTLANKMNDRGLTTTTGRPWQVQTIRKLLSNPRLAGHTTLSRMEGYVATDKDGKRVTKHRRVVDIITTTSGPTWQPILDQETWEIIRAKTKGGKRKQPPRVALLVGLIHCGECGAAMVTGARMTKQKTTQRVYRCSRVPGVGGCGKISARADALEEIVEAYARERLDDDRVRSHVTRLMAVPHAQTGEVTALEARLQELERQLDEPDVPVAAIVRAMDRTRVRLSQLQAEIATTARVELPERGGEWPDDLARRRALVALVVESVTLEPATRAGVFDPARVKIKRRD